MPIDIGVLIAERGQFWPGALTKVTTRTQSQHDTKRRRPCRNWSYLPCTEARFTATT